MYEVIVTKDGNRIYRQIHEPMITRRFLAEAEFSTWERRQRREAYKEGKEL